MACSHKIEQWQPVDQSGNHNEHAISQSSNPAEIRKGSNTIFSQQVAAVILVLALCIAFVSGQGDCPPQMCGLAQGNGLQEGGEKAEQTAERMDYPPLICSWGKGISSQEAEKERLNVQRYYWGSVTFRRKRYFETLFLGSLILLPIDFSRRPHKQM